MIDQIKIFYKDNGWFGLFILGYICLLAFIVGVQLVDWISKSL